MRGPSEWQIGRHTFRWEPPNVLWVGFDGDSTLSEAREMVGLYKALGEAQPFFLLADSKNAGAQESEARRYLSEHMRQEWLLQVIFYNTRLVHRAVAQGLILAAELFHAESSTMRGRVHFVATQARAHALLAQFRASSAHSPEAASAPPQRPG